MKITLFFVLFFSTASFAQSNRNIKQQLNESRDSLEVQHQIILSLAEELELAKSNAQTTAELLQKLRAENETLRKIMKDYVKQIDNSQTKILELQTELDNCKK